MDVKPYKGNYTPTTRHLKAIGVLTRLPQQFQRNDLEYDEGVDIVFNFKNLPPSRFAAVSDFILLAASEEAHRYAEENYKFAKIEVTLNRTAKGKTKSSATRTYTAAKNRDSEVMVYGEQALGYDLPPGQKKPYLIDKVKDILGIPDSPSPGAYVKKGKPYTVTSMIVAIRAGIPRGAL